MNDSQPHHSGQDRRPPSGRCQFCGQTLMDPNELVHPEMDGLGEDRSTAPHSPDALIKMQAPAVNADQPNQSSQSDDNTIKLTKVLAFLETLDLSPAEDKEVALAIFRRLETYHDVVVEDLVERSDSDRSDLAAWAVDADRLKLCRVFLEGIEL